MNFYEWEEWAVGRHDYWCAHLEAYIESLPTKCTYSYAQPRVEFINIAGKWSGRYTPHNHVCVYVQPYLFMLQEAFDETIAHEVCHAYQNVLYPGCHWHGEMFLYMLRSVCGFEDAQSRHNEYRSTPLRSLRMLYKAYILANPIIEEQSRFDETDPFEPPYPNPRKPEPFIWKRQYVE